jgi:NADPH:quinone reductase
MKTNDGKNLPATMRALELRSYEAGEHSLAVVERPVPAPGAGQVLVEVAAAPVNPSDLMFLRGLYGQRKRLPVVAGFEGAGRVVAAGGGAWARYLAGKPVACAAPFDGDGTWAEYMLAPAAQVIPLSRGTDLDQAASMIVNPFSAWALMGRAAELKAKALVQTAAASALGRMIVRLAAARGIETINIVRRAGQVEALRRAGATHVLDSTGENFDRDLRELCARHGATVAFEAVAGEMTGRVLNAMPRGARAILYGALSHGACSVDPRALIFEGKGVEGFWLADWLRRQNVLKKFLVARKVEQMLGGELKTEVRARVPLEEAIEGIRRYAADMTAGKILLVPRAGTRA